MDRANPKKAASKAKARGEIYALDPSKLAVCDIVLVSSPGVSSWAIRTGTASDFSHAALLTQPGMLLEAQPEGVHRRSPWGTYATKREWIKVLRPTFPVHINDSGLSLAQCAESRYGWGYSRVRAGGSPWPTLAEKAGSLVGTFCSEMVAQAFAQYGVDLLPDVPSSQITPGRLADSALLSDVTGSCIRMLHPVRDANEFRMVTKVHEREDPKYEMVLERKCLKKLRAHRVVSLSQSLLSLHEAYAWLSSLDMTDKANSRIDHEFLHILEIEGYFQFYEELAQEIGFGTRPFSEGMAAARALRPEQVGPDARMLLSDLERMLPTFEENFNARIASYEKSLALQVNGSKTLVRFREVQERLLAQASVLRQSRLGLIVALRRAASA